MKAGWERVVERLFAPQVVEGGELTARPSGQGRYLGEDDAARVARLLAEAAQAREEAYAVRGHADAILGTLMAAHPGRRRDDDGRD